MSTLTISSTEISSRGVRRVVVSALAAMLLLLASFGFANAAAPGGSSGMTAERITLLFDPRDPGSPTLSDVQSAVTGFGNPQLRSDLGNPVDARAMLRASASAEFLAQLAAHPMDARSLLERYIVLSYNSSAAAAAAVARLSTDARVLSVATDRPYTFSAIPIDTYYPTNPSFVGDYQWGMRSLNMPAAWDLEFGHAYVADIDTGIPCQATPNPCTGSTHPDLMKNFRVQFSYGFVPSLPPNNFNDTGGHGTHTAGIIAATPEYPPYFTNGQTNTGVAGTCWSCSLAVLTTDATPSSYANALTYAGDHGLQVANMSFGDEYATRLDSCKNPPAMYQSACLALQYAGGRDVVMVAAAGNGYENRVQFPARDGRVIAVGGIEYGDKFWRDGYGNGSACVPGQPGPECGSNYGPELDVVAPAMDIMSTFPPGATWNTNVHCGDSFPPLANSDGYGDCTGTSMSTPYVTGIVGLMRSVNPLKSAADIGGLLTVTARPCVGTDSTKCGAGIPDAQAAIRAVMGNAYAVNLLLPLFEFYSDVGQDHFFTTSPQMAMAALDSGNLLPQPPSPSNNVSYDPNGLGITSYPFFPNCSFAPCVQPRAMVSIFGSMISPLDGTLLVPLFRYSFACDPSIPFCNTRPHHISHAYSAGNTERPTWEANGYRFDGVEGYIFSKTLAQPTGTVKLCRKYDATRDDYAMFPGGGSNGTDCSATDDGTGQDGSGGNYNQPVVNTDWIGWVYPVQASAADLSVSAAAASDPSTIVTNLSGATFNNPAVRVQLDTASAGIHFGASSGCVSVPVSPPNFGSREAFSCALGTVAPGAVDKLHFWVQSGNGPGSGTMAVSLITPTDPPDTNSQNNAVTAPVNFQPPG